MTVSTDSYSQNSALYLTTTKLNGHNYLEWAQSVKLAIDGRGKIGHLTGEISKPTAGDPNRKRWQSENSLVIAWLINSMEPAIGKSHLFLPTAQDELDQCYDDVWENSNDYAHHKKREENDRVYMFLAGLNQSLDEVRGRILGRQPLPYIREAFSEVRREESRRKIMLHNTKTGLNLEPENSSLVSRSVDYENDGRNKPWCEHCKKPWHKMETCWKLHGVIPNSIYSWIIDSGATDHMTGCSKLFSSYSPCAGNKRVKIADGSLSVISGTGTIQLTSLLTLHDVLHVPNLSCNLLSISKLTSDHQCQANFYSSYCEF
ncbi:hypothetical protein I3760_01G090300 [Carya illinoinensis]|nr:hypothetical protein I3760_01G090300 [Carya illinoinensis]